MEEAKKTCLPEFLIRIGLLILKGEEKHQKADLQVKVNYKSQSGWDELAFSPPLSTRSLMERGEVADAFECVAFCRNHAWEDLTYQTTWIYLVETNLSPYFY